MVDTGSNVMGGYASQDTQQMLTRQLLPVVSLLHTLPGYHGSNEAATLAYSHIHWDRRSFAWKMLDNHSSCPLLLKSYPKRARGIVAMLLNNRKLEQSFLLHGLLDTTVYQWYVYHYSLKYSQLVEGFGPNNRNY